MKIKNILSLVTGLVLSATLMSCEDEKDLVIIEGNLPIKASALYMVGDATPAGWNIDNPTPFSASDEDPLIFSWEGELSKGELKLCTVSGSWDTPFIRPLSDGSEIGKSEITASAFQLHAGDPDEKWRVSEPGVYRLTFDLRNWTMSSVYVGAPSVPAKDPIQSDALYIVGDATPAGWNIDAPTQLEKKADYIYEWEGALIAGEFKACISTGNWDVPFVRPAFNGCKVSADGVEDSEIVYTANPDDKWRVEQAGIYHLSFNLENYTLAVEYKGEIPVSKDPIESETLYMIGDATPGGWSMDDATKFTRSAEDSYLFTWEGELVEGTMKACLQPDGTFSCPFLRPSTPNCEISHSGVAASDFVYTTNPDDQWKITESGRYKITFNLKKWTIEVTYLN